MATNLSKRPQATLRASLSPHASFRLGNFFASPQQEAGLEQVNKVVAVNLYDRYADNFINEKHG